ncbi:hypothetical protein [Candidatus Spongiihabitans sp.]|uniref:hypothetical protein n=1 Tax=Candidatus Spongiihabitans sp. TaxID=3101308 RepID=UPI003C7BAA85
MKYVVRRSRTHLRRSRGNKEFGVAELLILNVPLSSQRAFVLSIHHCLPSPSLPGPYYYWPGNPVIKPFGVAELLCFDAAPFDARMTGWEGSMVNRKAMSSFERTK